LRENRVKEVRKALTGRRFPIAIAFPIFDVNWPRGQLVTAIIVGKQDLCWCQKRWLIAMLFMISHGVKSSKKSFNILDIILINNLHNLHCVILLSL